MSNKKYSNIIQLSGESIGIKSLDNEIINYLNLELEEKMLMIVKQAVKYMRVTKRKTMKIDDLTNAMKFYNFNAPIGYEPYNIAEYEKIEGINGLWRLKQNIIDIDEYISKPLEPIPMKPIPHFYWFCLNGKRPEIPENFIRKENDILKNPKAKSQYLMDLDHSPDNMIPQFYSNKVSENKNYLLSEEEVKEAKNEERNYKILILNSPGRGDIKIF